MRNNNDRPTRRASGKRLTIAVICLTLSLICGITLAYVFTNTTPVENKFTDAEVRCDVVETFKNNEKRDVQIKNTGNVKSYIRATIVVTWAIDGKDADIQVYAKQPVSGTDYIIEMNELSGWVEAEDGFWYYTEAIAPQGYTDKLIDSCKPVKGKAPEGYHLSVEIIASAIQSKPTSVVAEQWSSGVSGVDANDLLQIKQKEVTQG